MRGAMCYRCDLCYEWVLILYGCLCTDCRALLLAEKYAVIKED